MENRSDPDALPPEPVRHRVQADGALWIEWGDGHQTSIPPRRLRFACPCAQCHEERSAARSRRQAGDRPDAVTDTEPDALPAGSIHLASAVSMGRYGLAPIWGDGHDTGIYTWDILRRLCDCVACRLARKAIAGC